MVPKYAKQVNTEKPSPTSPLRLRVVAAGRRDGCRARDDVGFTLIELCIVLVILPIVIAALAAGLVAVFSIQGTVTDRVGDSGDAQLVSASYGTDVQSAQELTTDANAKQCGTGTQLLGIEWNLDAATGAYETVVSYVEQQEGTAYALVRNDCTSGFSSTPTSSKILSFNLEVNQPAPVLSPAAENAKAEYAWIPARPVTNVQFSLAEPERGKSYNYALSAVPGVSSPPSTAGSPIINATTTTCGFAATEGGTVANGTYADTLCFVDFSPYNANEAAYPSCQTFIASIPGGDTLSFCMSESGNQPMFASALPTYPEAFLGNTLTNATGQKEPFYTGLGCPADTPPETASGGPTPSCIKPAMYQENTGFGPTNTLTFTNISVTTPTGAPATGWDWVSTDAETTDTGEYITWTSNQNWTLLPNSPSSPYGDTCNDLPNYNGVQGLGTPRVTCAASSQEPSSIKTGTPMIYLVTPTEMTVTMKGAGLEGIAVGLLLS